MPYKDKEKYKEYNKKRMRATRSDVQPSVQPEITIPERVFICRVQGHLCSLSRLEFIKCMEACNRADVWFSDRKDLRKAQEIIGKPN